MGIVFKANSKSGDFCSSCFEMEFNDLNSDLAQNVEAYFMEQQRIQMFQEFQLLVASKDIMIEDLSDKLSKAFELLKHKKETINKFQLRQDELEDEIIDITYRNYELKRDLLAEKEKHKATSEYLAQKEELENECIGFRDASEQRMKSLKDENSMLELQVIQNNEERKIAERANRVCENDCMTDIQTLLKDRHDLDMEISQNEREMKNQKDENQVLKNQLSILQEEIDHHKSNTVLEHTANEDQSDESFYEELQQVDPWKCDVCGDISKTKSESTMHRSKHALQETVSLLTSLHVNIVGKQ